MRIHLFPKVAVLLIVLISMITAFVGTPAAAQTELSGTVTISLQSNDNQT